MNHASINFVIFSAFFMKPLVEEKILENLPLRPGSQTFQLWKEPPVTPVLFLRIFNLTNKDAFMQGTSQSQSNVV